MIRAYIRNQEIIARQSGWEVATIRMASRCRGEGDDRRDDCRAQGFCWLLSIARDLSSSREVSVQRHSDQRGLGPRSRRAELEAARPISALPSPAAASAARGREPQCSARPDCRLSGPQEPAISSRPGTKVGASKIAPDLPIKGGTKVAAPSKKRTGGLPTGSFFRREAKNPVRADRKPLATAPWRARSLAACSSQGQNWPTALSLSQPSTSIDPLTSCSGPAANILR